MARPLRIDADVTATSAAGATRSPANAVTPRKKRGARRSCAICPARNTSHSATRMDTAKNAYGRISLSRTVTSSPRPLFAPDLARRQPAREYVERLLRVVRRGGHDVQKQQMLRRKRVGDHVAVVQ